MQLLLQLLDDVVLVVVEETEVLDVHVGLFELLFQVNDLALLVVEDDELGIDVFRGQVRYLGSTTGIVQRAQVLLKILV